MLATFGKHFIILIVKPNFILLAQSLKILDNPGGIFYIAQLYRKNGKILLNSF